MNLELKRPIVFFDLETTGIDVAKDRIVEIAMLKINPDQSREEFYSKINPQRPIPLEASLIHKIYDEDVKDAPTFGQLVTDIISFLKQADLGGYNSNRFDIPMLMEEMARVGHDLDIESRNSVDVQAIFFAMEKRTLEAAYKFYCHKELLDAHSASADINATYEVLLAQLDRYKEIENNVDFIATNFNNMADFVDNQRRFRKVGESIVLNFGKHKDKTIQKINQEDPGYFRWMYNADFGEHTKIKLKQICEELGIKL